MQWLYCVCVYVYYICANIMPVPDPGTCMIHASPRPWNMYNCDTLGNVNIYSCRIEHNLVQIPMHSTCGLLGGWKGNITLPPKNQLVVYKYHIIINNQVISVLETIRRIKTGCSITVFHFYPFYCISGITETV